MNGTARARLAESGPLRKAVQAQLESGLLTRMGLPEIDLPAGGHADAAEGIDATVADRLENFEPGVDLLEAVVQLVGRPPLLVKDSAVVFTTDEIDSLSDFPAG